MRVFVAPNGLTVTEGEFDAKVASGEWTRTADGRDGWWHVTDATMGLTFTLRVLPGLLKRIAPLRPPEGLLRKPGVRPVDDGKRPE